MFSNCNNSNEKGNVGLGQCIAYLTTKGYIVSLPLNDSQKYDLIFDNGIKLNKVQVKSTAQFLKNCYKVKLENCTHNFNQSFDNSTNDYIFVLCEDGSKYFIPSKEITTKTSLNLTARWDKYKV